MFTYHFLMLRALPCHVACFLFVNDVVHSCFTLSQPAFCGALMHLHTIFMAVLSLNCFGRAFHDGILQTRCSYAFAICLQESSALNVLLFSAVHIPFFHSLLV